MLPTCMRRGAAFRPPASLALGRTAALQACRVGDFVTSRPPLVCFGRASRGRGPHPEAGPHHRRCSWRVTIVRTLSLVLTPAAPTTGVDGPDAARLAARAEGWRPVHDIARRLGVLALAPEAGSQGWVDGTPAAVVDGFNSLLAGTLEDAHLATLPARCLVAFRNLEEFYTLFPRLLLRPVLPGHELECYRHNSATMDAWQRWMRVCNMKPGTYSGYISAVKTYAERTANGPVFSPEMSVARRESAKLDRKLRPPSTARKLCIGVGGADLERISAALPAPGVASRDCDMAVSSFSYEHALRGGEPGSVDGADFDSHRGVTIGCISWRLPSAECPDRNWGIADICPIKDAPGTARRCPIPFACRCRPGFTPVPSPASFRPSAARPRLPGLHDPVCSHCNVAFYWLIWRVPPNVQ